ncbi:hypothetical protein [Actinacidiphila sp. ITFR-21]|uniref:hypothetical protein n=1 Tax=Actinacidiphila sp. ITFR-21 TaxID=3075199 RepID=UPI00288A2507|nr:hypothetical protein [Streptomyces sp. ITFR-21]WNI17682.1 hypothetical protein RLT57_20545 [Streptomyces sp. ITFR-21]WNI17822.1 hypothetical protein RLT57_21260 [Streptomyces sp. ITFR-21]
MLLSPPERTIHPRYEIRTLKHGDDTPREIGVYDDNRQTYVRTMPLGTPDHEVRDVVAELERTRRPATVVYFARRATKKGCVLREMAVVQGDVIELKYGYRVVLDNGTNERVIRSQEHVHTFWGTTVTHFDRRFHDAEGGAITQQRVDIQGWTEPRHQELYYLVHNGSTAPWFADFALRYGLAGKHWQWDETVKAGNDFRPLNGNGAAHWLLKHWDREHPAFARSLYGI